MCAMRIADQMVHGASEIDNSVSNADRENKPVAAQSYAAPVNIPANRPDSSAEDWAHGRQAQFNMVTFKLCGRGREEWHDEKIQTEDWFKGVAAEPVPVVRLTDYESELRGIIHMRTTDKGTEVCLSLITPKGNWQTGIWFEIDAGDDVSVSWCTDWSGRELTTIALEIQQTEH